MTFLLLEAFLPLRRLIILEGLKPGEKAQAYEKYKKWRTRYCFVIIIEKGKMEIKRVPHQQTQMNTNPTWVEFWFELGLMEIIMHYAIMFWVELFLKVLAALSGAKL